MVVCVSMYASCFYVCTCACEMRQWRDLFVYLTKLQLHYSFKKKQTLKHSYQKDCMSHFMISFDPYFVHFKNTACLVPPQQFQIDIFIPGSETICCHIWCHFFYHQSVTEVNGTTSDALLLSILSLPDLSPPLCSCLLKDTFC